jgi:ribosomal protein S18 acetylase RimI-like enzyme
MHINLLPPYQRQGHGKTIITALLDRLRERGANGIHLGMVASNDNAYRFYHHIGFERFDEVMDGGLSGEKGRYGTAGEVGTIWLVKKL